MEEIVVEGTRLPPEESQDETPAPEQEAAPAAGMLSSPAKKRSAPAPAEQPVAETSAPNNTAVNPYQPPGQPASTFDSSAYEARFETCESAKSVAEECCTNPERCLTKPDGVSSDNEGMGGALIQLAAGTAMTVPSSSISAACGKMKTVSQAMSAVNGYLGYQCGSYVSQCKKACGPTAEELNAELDTCGDVNGYACKQISSLVAKFAVANSDCMTFDNQSARLANQAIANQMAAKYADQCKKMAEKKPDVNNPDLSGNPDCTSPTAASSAFCQAQCSRPGASSDPNCSGFFANNPNPGLGSNGNGDKSKNPLDGLVGDDEGTQNPNLADIAATKQQSSGGGSGGGGGGGIGGSGSGDGGGDAGSQGGGSGEGYDTDIGRGLASGNGYSLSGGLRSGGGGGGSFGSSTAITNSGKPFNLKDFLPGKNNLKTQLRGIASLASAQGISPAHGNIFVNVTNRFYQVCLRDALLDCATLKKMKKTGN